LNSEFRKDSYYLLIVGVILWCTDIKSLNKNVMLGTDLRGLNDGLSGKGLYSCKCNAQ